MTLLIEDTARNNLGAWAAEAQAHGDVGGVVVSPFSTPWTSGGWKASAVDAAERSRDNGVRVWLDPESHALQMPAVGDFRYYDDWELWPSARGRLTTRKDMRDHINLVYERQDALGAPHLAPTILLHSPQSSTSQEALRLAELAVEIDPSCYLAIAGDPGFWSVGAPLDAHIGGLAQLEPKGWWLTVARGLTVLPVQAIPDEVHGLCRTARALSDDGPVHVSHGDLAALPAVAAGASSLGAGWDPRQRVCAYASYEERDSATEGGQWFQQATFEGLLSLLPRADANVLAQQNASLATRLLPGAVPPGPKEAFLHHVEVLSRVAGELTSALPANAYAALRDRYGSARQSWTAVAAALGTSSKADAWVTPLLDGLLLYGITEGY